MFVVPPSTTTVICESARCSRAMASSRLLPWAITLAIIESNSGGMTSPSATPVSTRIPGPERQRHRLDTAGRRREAALRILGVQPRFDGEALRRRRLAVQATAGGDVQLQLDEIEPRRQLGHRVLHLQPGVHLEEREVLLGRLIQELDRPGVDVAGEGDEARRRGAQVAVLLRRQGDALRLLEHLLVAALHAAVANPARPHRAVGVGDDLHLHVARALDDALHEHRRITERLAAFGTGALERLGETGVGVDPPDAAAAATRGGLDHQRVADRRGLGARLLQRVDRAATPRRDRDVGLLGEQLGPDLVAEAAHHLGARPDEHDPQPFAQFGELRPLGDEAPPDPRRIRGAGQQRPLEGSEVEVRATGRRGPVVVETDPFVGIADEHRLPLGTGVQGDRAEVGTGLDAQLAHRVDQSHRRLAAIDHRDPTKSPIHHS